MKSIFTALLLAALIVLAGCINDTGSKSSGSKSRAQPSEIVTSGSKPNLQTRELNTVVSDKIAAESVVTMEQENPAHSKVKKSGSKSFDQPVSVANTAVSLQVMEVSALPLTHQLTADRENYLQFDENRVLLAREQPVSTFSVDVDTASYSNVRRMLVREGRLPPNDAVKVEEMINYFNYAYPQPEKLDVPFSVITEVSLSPWNPDRYLMQIGIRGYKPVDAKRPPANLVLLIDVSGSMMDQDKLPLVKRSLRLLVNQMNGNDRIALVVYAGAAGLVLDSTPASEREVIYRAIDALQAGGSTNGGAGLDLAYSIASQYYLEKALTG